MEYSKILSGEMFFYFELAFRSIVVKAILKDELDGDILRRALDKTQMVFPFMTLSVEEKNGYFYNVETNTQATLVNSKEDPVLGTKEMDGHLVAVVYYDRSVSIQLFHGLLDGATAINILQTLLYFYFCLRDGKEYPSEFVMTKRAEDYAKACLEPYANRMETSDIQSDCKSYLSEEILRYADIEDISGDENYIQNLQIPNKQLIECAQQNGLKPSIFLALLFCHAVQRISPDNKKVIQVNMPVNLRKVLNMPYIFRSCTGDIALFFEPDKMKEKALMEQGKIFNDEYRKKMEPENLKRIINNSIDFLHITEAYKSYDDKYNFYNSLEAPSSNTIFYNYFGNFQTEGYAKEFAGFESTVLPREGPTINVIDCGECFDVNVLMHGSKSNYCEALSEEIKQLGMDVILSKKRVYEMEYIAIREYIGIR